jgi:rSAM/selenodomain-associated transferase 1
MDWTSDLDCKVVNRTAIILFGRLPVPGKCKTRLAKSLGDRAAANVYKDMCENVVTQAAKSTASVIFMCSEKEDVPKVKKWLQPFARPSWRQIAVRAQVEGDLGERITAAFTQAFDDGCDEVIIAGTDVPDLSLDTFTLAFLHLQSFDVVIGPSEDDGYYLIGLNRKCMIGEKNKDIVKKLFTGIHWSTSLVYRDQVSIAYKLELSVSPYKCLPVLIDIDTAQDAELWLERVFKSPNLIAHKESGGLNAVEEEDDDEEEERERGGDAYKRVYSKLKAHFGVPEKELSLSFNITQKLKAILTSPPKRQDLPRIKARNSIAKNSGKKLNFFSS